ACSVASSGRRCGIRCRWWSGPRRNNLSLAGGPVVEPNALAPLGAWESFYVIVGSSAAALTGLQFVVVVLGAEVRALRADTVGAFGTPTIVHLCAALLISATTIVTLRAPSSAQPALGACALAVT